MINCQLVSPNGHALKKIDEWLTPAFPDWFKDLPSTRYKFNAERGTSILTSKVSLFRAPV